MQITRKQLNSYKTSKNEFIIRESKCFFFLQLFNRSHAEIDTLREKTFPLDLKLSRFPLINWRKNPLPLFQAVGYLPVKNSNYVLVGTETLDPDKLKTLAHVLRQEEVALIFGYQENTWFNGKRLLEREEPNTPFSQNILQVLNFADQQFSPTSLISSWGHVLLTHLDFLSHQPK